MELFNIYIQDILSQALDPLFLSTVMEQQGMTSSDSVFFFNDIY